MAAASAGTSCYCACSPCTGCTPDRVHRMTGPFQAVPVRAPRQRGQRLLDIQTAIASAAPRRVDVKELVAVALQAASIFEGKPACPTSASATMPGQLLRDQTWPRTNLASRSFTDVSSCSVSCKERLIIFIVQSLTEFQKMLPSTR